MDTSQLKSYAPAARRAFISAVSAQAAKLGITANGIAPAVVKGDVFLVDGQAMPGSVADPRKRLVKRVEDAGFAATMEAAAYTWFNRFVALRYMELHGYLDHGYRVLSHPESSETDHRQPEILQHAADIELPGLKHGQVVELKLAGNKDEELYRLLLVAQCNALNKAMPFLFEKIGDETELLLPAGLLHTDSLISALVGSIDERAWQQIEVIGWLYQFYISEKKEQVIGKVVKSEDIPAATQLFTPNWIVKYMVQNTLGAQWLATYPNSPLRARMEYYIAPAEQTDEVKAQLAETSPSVLNPEELTLLDPACGSGHILVEAYDVLKAIYLERGYRQREVPKLVLEKNLFGLDIDERAAQLAGFALMMKGRADDRGLFERGVKLNVMALVDSGAWNAEGLAKGVELSDYGLQPGGLTELKQLFEHATTLGSLIQVPDSLTEKLAALKQLSEETSQDLFVSDALRRMGRLVSQANMLSENYDAVVANPPYIGSKFHTPDIKRFLKDHYRGYENDLFAGFIRRNLSLCAANGRLGFMSPQVWLFLSSYERVRSAVLENATLTTLVHPEYNAFWDSAHVALCTFTLQKTTITGYEGTFIRLAGFFGAERQPLKTLEAINDPDCGWLHRAKADGFKNLPGRPIAYWFSERVLGAFRTNRPLGAYANPNQALVTGNTERHVRNWSEVALCRIGFGFLDRESARKSGARWFPYNKGGPFRNWYGNYWSVVNWENDGHELRTTKHPTADRTWAHNFVLDQIFHEALVWAKITSARIGFRYSPGGFLFDDASGVCPTISVQPIKRILAFLVTPVAALFSELVSATVNMQPGDLASLPYVPDVQGVDSISESLVLHAKLDWDAYERSWDFQSLAILEASSDPAPTLESSYNAWITQNRDIIAEMKRLEEENNRLFIDAYGLKDELTPDVPIEQITLTVNPAYRYGIKLNEEERETRFREDTMEELVSYAIGCMMGRYSLDEPGLIYANAGNEGFDPNRYATFPADEDGILPLTDSEWFADDTCQRLVEFVSVAWDKAHLEENLAFLANNLSPKKNESSRDTLRRYLCDKFFKDHVQTYKKRPIYWLFSSGKQKAFQCLVYLHRYNAGTLARMRSEYVIPLQGKLAARVEKLDTDIPVASSTAEGKRLTTERAKLVKHQTELLAFDEKLRHFTDQRITLDLDDGVKVNYGKFGDLLADVKAITGGKEDS